LGRTWRSSPRTGSHGRSRRGTPGRRMWTTSRPRATCPTPTSPASGTGPSHGGRTRSGAWGRETISWRFRRSIGCTTPGRRKPLGSTRSGRRAPEGRRAPQGRDPGVPPRTSGDARPIQRRRPARPDPGGHGHVLLRPRRPADRDGTLLRFELPRRGPPDVPQGCLSNVRCERGRPIPREAGNLSEGGITCGDRGGSPGGVQERGRCRPSRGRCGPDQDRRPDGPPRSREGMNLTIKPFGHVNPKVLEHLCEELHDMAEVSVSAPETVPDSFVRRNRDGQAQYLATEFEKAMAPEKGDRVLAVTDVDLFDHGLNFVFGHATIRDRFAV